MAETSAFKRLAMKVAAEYRKKGYSASRALLIGRETAAKIGDRKYGIQGMERKAQRGRQKRHKRRRRA